MSDGRIEYAEDTFTFRSERLLPDAGSAVWKAITEPEQIARWFGARVEIDLEVSGQYISYHQGDMRVVDRIVRLEAPRLLEHTFWAEVNPGALVTWEIQPRADGCALALSHSLPMADVESAGTRFGGDPTFILSRNAAGWHHILDKLEAVLAGNTLDWSEEEQRALQTHYAAMLTGIMRARSGEDSPGDSYP